MSRVVFTIKSSKGNFTFHPIEVKKFIGLEKTRQTLNELRRKYPASRNPVLTQSQHIRMYERRLIAEFCNSVFAEDIRDQNLARYHEQVICCFKNFAKFEKILDFFIIKGRNGIKNRSANPTSLQRRGSFEEFLYYFSRYPFFDKLSHEEREFRIETEFPVKYFGWWIGKAEAPPNTYNNGMVSTYQLNLENMAVRGGGFVRIRGMHVNDGVYVLSINTLKEITIWHIGNGHRTICLKTTLEDFPNRTIQVDPEISGIPDSQNNNHFVRWPQINEWRDGVALPLHQFRQQPRSQPIDRISEILFKLT